ncbi:MAG: glutamate 5-kinase [Candidatus Omnitrophota bacterium]
MKQSQKKYDRIVIKIGSSLIFSKQNTLDCSLLSEITAQVSGLMAQGKKIVLVSSGAIAIGMSILKLESRPKELSYLQAAAAIGQHELMDNYRKFFKQTSVNCGQVLLTWEDFDERSRYLNAKNTLLTLLKLNTVPVVNENDTVSTSEIKFGDNDKLSALVSIMVGADLLIILSDVDGLLDKDKKVIRIVDKVTPALKQLACPTGRKTCVGGMITKLEAARISIDSGIPCIIANGRVKDVIKTCVEKGHEIGTLFVPKKEALAAKMRWIAFGTKPKGKIIVDDGAREALENKKSLLAVGVIALEGEFVRGDIVTVRDEQGEEVARGKAGVSSEELKKVKGARYDKEVIHRNNIVIL